MFLDFSKEKLVRLSLVSAFIIVFVFVSFMISSKFNLIESYNLYTRKSNGQISYMWSQKILPFLKNPKEALANLRATTYSQDPDGQRVARSIPILVYHGLPNEGIGQIPHDAFAEQMKALSDKGWKTITLEDYIAFIRRDRNLPEKSFLLTFDDGRKDTFYPADPVLKDFGFHAVMFIISKKSATDLESSYYMSQYELEDMEKSGRWEIESHGRDSHDWYNLDAEGTIGHFFSNRLWLPEENRIESEAEFRERVIYDLVNSRNDLETALGKNVSYFAYPFSDFGQDTVNYPESIRVLKEETPKIYTMAFYQVWRGLGETFNYPKPGLFMSKRIEPHSDWDGEFLVNNLEAGLSKDVPYEKDSFGLEWIAGWGEVKTGETLELAAKNDTSGASATLNGSWFWEDYTFAADVNWKSGSNVVLVARRDDENNYYGCNWSPNKIAIKRSSDASSYNIISQDYYLPASATSTLGIRVNGSQISCLVNGQVILEESSINNRIINGGIGVEVWDESLGKANASFDNVRVTPI